MADPDVDPPEHFHIISLSCAIVSLCMCLLVLVMRFLFFAFIRRVVAPNSSSSAIRSHVDFYVAVLVTAGALNGAAYFFSDCTAQAFFLHFTWALCPSCLFCLARVNFVRLKHVRSAEEHRGFRGPHDAVSLGDILENREEALVFAGTAILSILLAGIAVGVGNVDIVGGDWCVLWDLTHCDEPHNNRRGCSCGCGTAKPLHATVTTPPAFE